MSTLDEDSNLWNYAALIAAAGLASWLVSLQLLTDVFSGPLSLVIVAVTLLCGLRVGPTPLLLVALIYLAFTEPAEMLSRRPLSSICIAGGLGLITLCLSQARFLCKHHDLRFWRVRQLFTQVAPLPSKELAQTFSAIVIAVCICVGVALLALWLVPLSSNSLRVAGLRPTALRVIQITFLFASAYVVTRLFILQMAFRTMRSQQARMYLGSLLSGWLLPDVRGMHRKPRRKRKLFKNHPTQK